MVAFRPNVLEASSGKGLVFLFFPSAFLHCKSPLVATFPDHWQPSSSFHSILINTMSTNSTLGTEPGFLDQTGALSLLSSLCENKIVRILPEHSHFFQDFEVPQNQRFHNGAYIWEADNDTAISSSTAIANVTMLGSGRSGLFQISRQPFHPKVVREFTVGPPEEKDPFAISRLYIMEEGIYTVRTELWRDRRH